MAGVTQHRYGQATLDTFRALERSSVKHAKCLVDLKFLSTCRDADLVPVFLQFKLSSRRLGSSAEVLRTRRRLLTVEINAKERDIRRLEEQMATFRSRLKDIVWRIDFIYYINVIQRTCEVSKMKWAVTHERKLLNLRAHSRPDIARLDPESVITNLSSYELSDLEKRALAKGLKFSLPPSKLKKGNYLSSFELLFDDLSQCEFVGSSDDKEYFRKKLAEIAFSSLFKFNNTRRDLLNIPKEEFLALKSLSKNKNIVIMKPDKGSGIVILNRADYITKMEEIVNDSTKFKLTSNQDVYGISRTIENRVRTYLREHVKKPGYISDEVYKQLYPNGSHIGVLYGLPKVHKRNNPMRPICSMVGTSTYELGKFVAKLIQPAAVNKHGTDLNDTFQFVSQISLQNLNDCTMASFDVQSLFTNVPLTETIDVCMNRLYRGDPNIVPDIPEHVLRKLLSLCVCDNTFVFNGKVYSQTDGVAMGSSLGSVMANIWMTHLEETHIFGSQFYPSYYSRYVDDTFCIFRQPDHVTKFLDFLNSLNPSTQFDLEIEMDGKLSFLDTVVSKENLSGRPEISTKVKDTDKGLFYNFSSFVPERYKENLVCCLVYRIFKIASTFHIFDNDLQRLCCKLYNNGFPKKLVEECVSRILEGFYTPKIPVHTVPRKELMVIMPYLGQMSVVLKRDILKLVKKFYPTVELKIVYKRGFQLSNMFNFKDKFAPKCLSNIVYYIQCSKCEQRSAYIGKTINTLYERFYGSNGHLNPRTVKSALLDHIAASGDPECEFNFDNIKIIDHADNDHRLRIVESIYCKFDKQTLNTQEYSYPLKLF